MPIKPNTGKGGGGGNKTSVGLGNVDNTSDLAKPISTATQTAINYLDPMKTIRIFDDLIYSSISDVFKPVTANAVLSGTITPLGTDGNDHVGIFQISSSTTANSGVTITVPHILVPVSSNPTLTLCFKTPASFNANSTIMIGTIGVTVTSDRHGLQIIGDTAQSIVVNGGSTTSSGGFYLMSANTWYIAKIEIKNSSNIVCTLYADNGASVYTHTANTALTTSSVFGIRAINSGTTALSICNVDYINVVCTATANRAIV